MCARTLWPFDSSTRNIAFGRASTTLPSISMTPSFFAISSANSLVDFRPTPLHREPAWLTDDDVDSRAACPDPRGPEVLDEPETTAPPAPGRTHPTDDLTASAEN